MTVLMTTGTVLQIERVAYPPTQWASIVSAISRYYYYYQRRLITVFVGLNAIKFISRPCLSALYKSGFISTAIIGFARSVMLHRKLQKFLFLPKLLMQSLLGRPFGLLKPFGQDWDSCCLRSCWHRLLQTSFCARLLRSTPDSTHKRTPARVSLSFYRRDSPPSIMETCMH